MLASRATSTPVRLRRHQRVWLDPSMAANEIAGLGDDEADAVLTWLRRGLPFVCRSASINNLPQRISLGLKTSTEAGGARLGFTIDTRHVRRVQEPLALAEAIDAMPAPMRTAALQLADRSAALAVPVHVYGSVSWQHASRDVYLHGSSDLDILARPASQASAEQWVSAVRIVQAAASVRIDGEIELPCGGAVAWREWAGSSRTVVVKTSIGPELRNRDAVWPAEP
jgi:phosphoribosyl-dephospho-CoA transferase